MARSMFSRGMLFALASAMIVRRRGLVAASPPPFRAATVNSLMMRVNALPRLASAAPFLCLIVCHLEWPDMGETPTNSRKLDRVFYHAGSAGWPSPHLCPLPFDLQVLGKNHPDIRAGIPRAAAVITEQRRHLETGLFEPPGDLRH